MKATINNTAPKITRNFKVGDIVIDNNDGHVVLITYFSGCQESFNGISLIGAGGYLAGAMCEDIDKTSFNFLVGTITLEN